MSHRLTSGIALLGLLSSWTVFADEHCKDPVADWQPREILRQQVEQYGWQVHRIKVDDGCYEVRGLDRRGNAVEAKFSPASLRIRAMEVEFSPTADTADYLPQAQ